MELQVEKTACAKAKSISTLELGELSAAELRMGLGCSEWPEKTEELENVTRPYKSSQTSLPTQSPATELTLLGLSWDVALYW